MRTQKRREYHSCHYQEGFKDPGWLLPASSWVRGTPTFLWGQALLEKGRNQWTSSHFQCLLELAVLRGAEIWTVWAPGSPSRSPHLSLFFTSSWELQASSAPRGAPPCLFCFLRCLFLKPGLLLLNWYPFSFPLSLFFSLSAFKWNKIILWFASSSEFSFGSSLHPK